MPDQVLDALIFDFDGLILDTESSAFHSAVEAFAAHGTVLELSTWQAHIGTSDHPHWTEILADQLGRPVDRGSIEPERTRRKLELLAPEQVRPGVVDLLDAARQATLPLAVASSSPADWVVGHLTRFDLASRFATVATRTDVGDDPRRTKPAPDIYRIALERLGVAPTRVVAFEDSPNGVAAAKAAGLWCVAAPGPITHGLDFSAADLVVGSLAEVSLATLHELTTSA